MHLNLSCSSSNYPYRGSRRLTLVFQHSRRAVLAWMLQQVRAIAALNISDRSLITGSDDQFEIIPDGTFPTFGLNHLVFTWFQFPIDVHAIHGSALLKLCHLVDPFPSSRPRPKENLHILYRTTKHKAADGFGPIMFFWIGLSDIGTIICLFDLILAALDQLVARFPFPVHWQQRSLCFYIYQNILLFFCHNRRHVGGRWSS